MARNLDATVTRLQLRGATALQVSLTLFLAGWLASVSGCTALSPSLACAGGNAVACARLGDEKFKGGQTGADLEGARSYFERSCGHKFLAGCYGAGRVAMAQQRFADAVRLLTDTCKRGYGPACTTAGDLQRTQNGKRPELAVELYTAACERLDAEGCLQLALLEEAGAAGADPRAAPAHYRYAFDEYRSRCQAGYGSGCYRYAEFFAHGWGIDTNQFQVRRLMEKSCGLGHAPACEYHANMGAR